MEHSPCRGGAKLVDGVIQCLPWCLDHFNCSHRHCSEVLEGVLFTLQFQG
jgi:hypothetical protein